MDAQTVAWLIGAVAVGLPVLVVLHKCAQALVWLLEALAAVAVFVLLLVLVVKYTGKLVWLVLSHPRSSLALLLGLCIWHWIGWLPASITLTLAVAGGLVWRHYERRSFEHWIGRRLRAWWLRWTMYHPKLPRWAARLGLVAVQPETSSREGARPKIARGGMAGMAAGLVGAVGSSSSSAARIAPKVTRVQSGPSWDRVRVKLPQTEIPEDWAELTRALATARKVERCTVHEVPGRPGVITVDFLRRDLLQRVGRPDWTAITAQTIEDIDLHRVPCGWTEYGTPLFEDMASLSGVYGGETGAGKASAMWAPHIAMAPAIAAGNVRLIGLDPKGVELAYAPGVFDYYADNPEQAAELLEWIVENPLRERADRIKGNARKVQIDWSCPLWVIEFDELSHWCRYLTDKKLRDRIVNACSVIITQGRALGFVLRGYAQSPLKDDVPFRDLIPRRTALRSGTKTQVDALLGDNAADSGAWAHRIAESEQGMAYRIGEGIREPERVRYDFPDDDVLKTFEAYVLAGRASTYADLHGPVGTLTQ